MLFLLGDIVRMMILIIDNDPHFLKSLQSAFEKQDYKVITTTNSIMASSLFFQYRPEAVILNVSMPDKDGFELVKEIRTFCRRTFILALSSHDFYLRMIKKLGANEALSTTTKPESIITQLRTAVLFSCLQSNSFKETECGLCQNAEVRGKLKLNILSCAPAR
jgi:DNA-binding response OmpR family regulator